jgi:hypothetical protein
MDPKTSIFVKSQETKGMQLSAYAFLFSINSFQLKLKYYNSLFLNLSHTLHFLVCQEPVISSKCSTTFVSKFKYLSC